MPSVRGAFARGSPIALVVAVAYGAGVVTGVVGGRAEPSGDVAVVAEAAEEIADNAAEPVGREELEQAAIDGMLRALDDPWSRYYTPGQYENFQSSLTGRSSSGTSGRPPLDRQDGRPVKASGVSVRYREGDVMVLDVAEFTRGVGHEVRRAVTGRRPRGTGGIILDLRGNPGGLLTEAVSTASVFLEGGPVVAYERRSDGRHVLRATGHGDTVTPLVVLVDGGSASAAEVVAGALQDRNRAVVVGSRTYGKATVQQAYRLDDGSALKFTVGRYYTPAGRSISEQGIVPDVFVSPEAPPASAERRAREVLSGLLVALPDGKGRG